MKDEKEKNKNNKFLALKIEKIKDNRITVKNNHECKSNFNSKIIKPQKKVVNLTFKGENKKDDEMNKEKNISNRKFRSLINKEEIKEPKSNFNSRSVKIEKKVNNFAINSLSQKRNDSNYRKSEENLKNKQKRLQITKNNFSLVNENLEENQSKTSLISNIFGMFGNKKEDKNKAIKKSNLKDIYPQKNVESFSIIPINKNKKKEIKLYSDKFRKLNIKPISKVQSFEIIHSYTKPQNQIEAYKFSILSQIDLMRSSLKDEQSEEDNKSKKSRKYSKKIKKI